jgi:hypothetical protein
MLLVISAAACFGQVNITSGGTGTVQIGGSGGGSGTVTSVNGTSAQIDVTGTTAPIVSLDPAIVLPGTMKGYRVNNTFYEAGFTAAIFGGIGVNQVAWASGVNEPLCQATYYSGNNYVSVGTNNGSVTPGTNSQVWWPVAYNYNVAPIDCAFYYALGSAAAAATKLTLMLPDTTASGPLHTNLCLVEPASAAQVNIIGNGIGWNGGPTQIQASAACGYIISAPDQSGSLPYGTRIENLQLDGGGVADCMNFAGNKVMHILHIGCQNYLASSTNDPFIVGGTHGAYQNEIEDIFVQGTGAPSHAATVTATFASGNWTFTITGGTNYTNIPTNVFVTGFGAGTGPCATNGGAFTVTYSGTGPYTLTGIVQHGTWAGCVGPFYFSVPDMPANYHGIVFNNLTDSTFNDIVVSQSGQYYGIFYNGVGNSVMNHEHPYGPMGKAQIYDPGGDNVHIGAELDTIQAVGAVTGGTGGSTVWVGTTLPLSTSIPGQVAFSNTDGKPFSIINTSCKNTTTSSNPFYLVANSSGPIAHGGNFGNITVVNGLECDTLTTENSFPSPLTVPGIVSYLGTTAGSADAYTLVGASISYLQPGLQIKFLPSFNNATTTPTINVNGLGAVTITKNGQSALAPSDLTTTALANVTYDGTYFQLINPQTAGNTGSGGAIGYSGTPSLNTSVLYLSANGNLSSTTAASVGWPAPSAAPITSLQWSLATAPATTATIILYDGSTAESVRCQITNPATSCQDIADTFTPSVGDLLTWQVQLGSSTLSANSLVSANWGTPPMAIGCLTNCNYFVGTDSAGGTFTAGVGGALSNTNVPQMIKFWNSSNRKIGNACFDLTASTAASHISIAIYSVSGTTMTRQWTTGQQASTSNGVQCVTPAAYSMPGGQNYYIGWCSDSTTPTLASYNNSGYQSILMSASAAPANTAGVDSTDTCTAGTMPATMTTTNVTNTSLHLSFPLVYGTN